MSIDPNIYIGAAVFATGALVGYVMGIVRPYLDKRLLRANAPKPAPQPQGKLTQAQQPAGGA